LNFFSQKYMGKMVRAGAGAGGAQKWTGTATLKKGMKDSFFSKL
jgi:hypothetical protein